MFKEKYKQLFDERLHRISDVPALKSEFPPYKLYKNQEGMKLRTWGIPVDDTFSTLRLFNIHLTPIQVKDKLTLEILVDDGTTKTAHEFPLNSLYKNPKLPDNLFFVASETKHIDIVLPKGRKKVAAKLKISLPTDDFEMVLACEWVK